MGLALRSIPRVADLTGFVLRRAWVAFMRNRGLERAAVLAYNSFFSLFPLMLLLLYVVGRFMASSQAAMGAIERLANQVSPFFSEVILREVRGLATQKAWGLVSLAMLIWGVTPMAGALRGAFDAIYKTDRAMPFLKEKLKDVVAVLLIFVLLILLVAGEIAYSVVTSRLAQLSWLVRCLDVAAPMAVAVGFLLIVHYTFSPVRPSFWAVAAGCLVSAGLLAVLNPLFAAVVTFDPNYGLAFGSLKAVFLMLVWVYACFVIILAGAEVAAAIHRKDALLVHDLLAGAATQRSRQLARLARFTKSMEPESVVFREGDPGDSMYYVVEGSVSLRRGEQELRRMKAGEYFGEMAMLIKTSRTATAVVSEPGTQLIVISAANIETVLRENPKIVLSLLREMAERLRRTNEIVAR